MYFIGLKERNFDIFLDQISTVKIVSTVWLNNNQIILCREGNTAFLYDIFVGKFLNFCLFFASIIIT